jgi:hypothetical protein
MRVAACRAFALAVAVAVAVPMAGMPAGAAAGPAPVALPPAGQVSFSYVGRIEQNGVIADDFGYLTSIAGLDEAALFTGSDPLSRSEATARFTYFATARLTMRSVNGNLFATSGTAETTLYLNQQGGARFDQPTSFKRGMAVATWTSRWHDIVNVQQPNRGIARAESDETQRSAHVFTLGGRQYVLGRAGLLSRLSFTGEGSRTEPAAPHATIVYAGEDTLLQQGALPAIRTAASGTPGWAYAAVGLAVVAMLIAAAALLAVRRGRAVGG